MIRPLAQNSTLDGNAINPTQIESRADYASSCARAKVTLESLPGGVVVNDPMDLRIGYAAPGPVQVFTGYIDAITYQNEIGTVVVEGRDVLKRAINHLMVPEDPQQPVASYDNTAANVIVGDLLDRCGLINYVGDACAFNFGVQYPAEFFISTVWDSIVLINNIIVWHCWAEPGGQVRFADVKPVPGASSHTFKEGEPAAGGNLVYVSYTRKDDGLRNRVVVFGRTLDDGTTIRAEASAGSPYVPVGYHRTAVISSQLIDIQSMAQNAANFNLTAWNKLDESVEAVIEGNPNVQCRQTVTVQETFTGLNNDWFVASATHLWGPGSYTTRLTLVK